jgi:hypothetical protein
VARRTEFGVVEGRGTATAFEVKRLIAEVHALDVDV